MTNGWDRGSRVSSARGYGPTRTRKRTQTVLAPTLDDFGPKILTKYVIWASVITTTLFEVPGRVRPGGRSDRRSRFYAPSRFRRTCDLGFERFWQKYTRTLQSRGAMTGIAPARPSKACASGCRASSPPSDRLECEGHPS